MKLSVNQMLVLQEWNDKRSESRMKVICMICGKTIVKGKPRPVSHGICKVCLPGYIQEQERIIEKSIRERNL